jgi:hypothetical protein
VNFFCAAGEGLSARFRALNVRDAVCLRAASRTFRVWARGFSHSRPILASTANVSQPLGIMRTGLRRGLGFWQMRHS